MRKIAGLLADRQIELGLKMHCHEAFRVFHKNRIWNGVALAQVVSRIRKGGPWEVQPGADQDQEAFDVVGGR